ncbi:MAG TPA: hypothetical protein VL281_01440, partial [Mycobacteriales bacterium]|nr:hypothetical protein [Mycobacteriales bacterium]
VAAVGEGAGKDVAVRVALADGTSWVAARVVPPEVHPVSAQMSTRALRVPALRHTRERTRVISLLLAG